MKRLKDPNTMMIAVAMMLVAVSALMFFTEPVAEVPPPSPEELAPVLGKWVSVIDDDPTDSSYNGKAFTLRDDLYCDFDALGKRCQYTYDIRRQTVTVLLPENPAEGMTYTLEAYQGFAALKLGDRYYVREEDHASAQDMYLLQLDLQPPEIIQRTEAELAPVLGPWKNWTGKTNLSTLSLSWQNLTFFEDMTCIFTPSGAKYSYNYDPLTKKVTIYTEKQKSHAMKYVLTEAYDLTLLHCYEWTLVMGVNQEVRSGDFYARTKDYPAAHEAYTQQTQLELYNRHQATRDILLEGKVSAAEILPYHQEGCLDIYSMHGSTQSFSDVSLTVYMTTPASKGLKILEALQDVRLVTTSTCDNWTQADLEEHFGVWVTSIHYFDGSTATPDSGVYIEEYQYPNCRDELLYYFDLSQYSDGGAPMGPPWKIEDLGYQDLFVFFRIYGEDDVYYFQLDS